jgi:hypothetical protein
MNLFLNNVSTCFLSYQQTYTPCQSKQSNYFSKYDTAKDIVIWNNELR